MRYFLILFTLTYSLFGVTINDSLLKIHATLVPKIYLMDYKYKEKIDNNSIVIALVYKDSDYKNALSLKNKIKLKYGGGIKSYKIEVKLIPYSKIDRSDANIYYLFPSTSENIKKVIQKANENQALTFSYLNNDLRYGVMASLKMGNKVKPLLNLDAIKLHNISFRPILLNISSIFSQTSNNAIENLKIKGSYNYESYLALLKFSKNTKRNQAV